MHVQENTVSIQKSQDCIKHVVKQVVGVDGETVDSGISPLQLPNEVVYQSAEKAASGVADVVAVAQSPPSKVKALQLKLRPKEPVSQIPSPTHDSSRPSHDIPSQSTQTAHPEQSSTESSHVSHVSPLLSTQG